MKIGIDARLWNESGVGRYTRNLVLELAKIDQKNQYILFFRAKEFATVSLPGKNFEKKLADVRWHTLNEQLRLPSILNKENLDLVHFPYFSVPLFYNKPFVVTIHDLILHHFPTGQASTLPSVLYWTKLFGYKFIIAQAGKRAKKVIAVSQATKDEIVDHLSINEKKVVVTYEGAGTKISNKSLDSTNKMQNTKYFLYVGNAYPHKNLDPLISAYSEFRNQNSKVKLILVGKEDYFYKRLKEKVKQMKLEDSVIFYGEATDQDLISLYKNALALVSPSLMEGFGLPVLEAMSNKCLVLASDIPVYHEIAGDAAIYFDPTNTNEICEKMLDVCKDDSVNFSKNINAGLEKASLFSWSKMAKETLSVYESSIGL